MKNMDKNSKRKPEKSSNNMNFPDGGGNPFHSSHAIIEKSDAMEVIRAEAVYLLPIDCKRRGLPREIYEAAPRTTTDRLQRDADEDMTFYYIHSMEEDLEPGYFSIPEPKTSLPGSYWTNGASSCLA